MSAGSARVLVVDDQTIVREGLALIVGLLPAISLVGTAADGEQALSLVAVASPDVVLMDLRMPRMSGVEATRRILTCRPNTKILVLTTYCDDESVTEALRAGAHGYLTKDVGAGQIAQAIIDVLKGDPHFDAIVQQRLVAMAVADATRRTRSASGLTPREIDVLRLIAKGRCNNEIAMLLCVTEATVKSHINNLFAKIGTRTRAQAVTYAFQNGLTADRPLP